MKTTDLERLQNALTLKPEASLMFDLDGVSINQGYHVTEVKHARIQSLDCGKRTDAWEEVLIQLLDGQTNSVQGFMSASKFQGIVSKALSELSDSSSSKLFFEYASGNKSLQKLEIRKIDVQKNDILIRLRHVSAVCKPLERWGIAGDILDKSGVQKSDVCCGNTLKCCS